MKLKRHINFINENTDSEDNFILKFIQKCPECEGEGKIDKEVECSGCSGEGYTKEYDENDMDYDVECERCSGEGYKVTEDSECESCNEGHLIWNLEYRKGEGIHNMFEDYGNADQPIQYDDGRIAYNHPDIFPDEIKDIVKFIFDNKDLKVKELINSVARYAIKEEYTEQFKFHETMEDYFNDDTNRILTSSKGIDKYNL